MLRAGSDRHRRLLPAPEPCPGGAEPRPPLRPFHHHGEHLQGILEPRQDPRALQLHQGRRGRGGGALALGGLRAHRRAVLLHRAGEPAGAGVHLPQQAPAPGHVHLHRQPGGLGPAGRRGLHGQHAAVGQHHLQPDARAVVRARGHGLRHAGRLGVQPAGHRHRAARGHHQGEGVQQRQELPHGAAHRRLLGDRRRRRQPAHHGLELHQRPGRLLHRAAALLQALRALRHHHLHAHPHGHRGALHAHLLHRALQPRRDRLGADAGAAQDRHHCAGRLHRLLAARLHHPPDGRLVPRARLPRALQRQLLLRLRHAQLGGQPGDLHAAQQGHAQRVPARALLLRPRPGPWAAPRPGGGPAAHVQLAGQGPGRPRGRAAHGAADPRVHHVRVRLGEGWG